jgi:hypothetical protein
MFRVLENDVIESSRQETRYDLDKMLNLAWDEDWASTLCMPRRSVQSSFSSMGEGISQTASHAASRDNLRLYLFLHSFALSPALDEYVTGPRSLTTPAHI